MRAWRSRARGFTLIEALVAVTLLALMFGALMPVFQNGLAVLRSGDRHSRAVLLAQSILDGQLAIIATEEQSSAQPAPAQGKFDDYEWQVTRVPFVVEQQADTAADGNGAETEDGESPFTLTQVSVAVRWPQNEFGVQLHSLALEPAK